ncbi:unnamed protein product [Anisakis simplex]|uniref:Uncharacterized protein n=1 Tax=Anisakis simplex TaxID=6269 RepID=A0A0M3JQN1_ANISI|nr:unnamed protein product [Anisakis simplex]
MICSFDWTAMSEKQHDGYSVVLAYDDGARLMESHLQMPDDPKMTFRLSQKVSLRCSVRSYK